MSERGAPRDVPAFYLQRFANPRTGRVELYDLERASAGEASPPQALAGEPRSAPGDDAAHRVLDDLLDALDALGEAHFERVLAGEDLDGDARHAFAFFVSSLYLRSPFVSRLRPDERGRATQVAGYSHASLDDAWAAVERDAAAHGASTTAAISRARRVLGDSARQAADARGDPASSPLVRLPAVARAIVEMQWTVTRASGGSFVTSDSPVTLGSSAAARSGLLGVGLAASNALLSLPLSPAACWLGHWGQLPDPHAWRSATAVRELNRQRVERAVRVLVATPHTHNLAGLARHRPTNVVKLVPFGRSPPPARR